MNLHRRDLLKLENYLLGKAVVKVKKERRKRKKK